MYEAISAFERRVIRVDISMAVLTPPDDVLRSLDGVERLADALERAWNPHHKRCTARANEKAQCNCGVDKLLEEVRRE